MTNKKFVWQLEKEKKIDDRQFGIRKPRGTIDTTLMGSEERRKQACNKINRNKILEQLENMGIQGQMMKFSREMG